MNSGFRFCITLIVSIALGGCIHFDRSVVAEPIEPSRSIEQHPCCDSLLSLQVSDLPLNQYVTLVIDRNDPVLEFRKGKSFAKVLTLPKVDNEFLLQLDSVVNFPRLDFVAEAFYPSVTLLDDQLNPVATYDNEKLDLRNPIFGPDLLRIILTIEPGSSARYAVVHTSPDRLIQGLSVNPPHQIVTKSGFDTMLYGRSTQSRKKIYFVETGMINVLAYSRND